MGWKLWQVVGGVGERHGDVPSLSNFNPPTLLNMNSYVYYNNFQTVGASTNITTFGYFMRWLNAILFIIVISSPFSKLVGSDKDVCAPLYE